MLENHEASTLSSRRLGLILGIWLLELEVDISLEELRIGCQLSDDHSLKIKHSILEDLNAVLD